MSKPAERAWPVPILFPKRKHPLQDKWTLWFLMGDSCRHLGWEDRLKPVATFGTVEDFWSLVNYVSPPSRLEPGSDYMVFREGVQPMWEDAGNRAGGRWLLNLDKKSRQVLDDCWEELLMLMVGDGFGECAEEICGSVVQVRHRGLKLAVWTARADREKEVHSIGELFKRRLALGPGDRIKYESHDSAAAGGKTKPAMVL